jgi:RNA-directed DNA polymerase
MTSSVRLNQTQPQQALPILSLNKFSFHIGIRREKLENIAENSDAYYAPFQKKTGQEERLIDNPTGLLKEAQSRIHDRILSGISLPDYVIGGVKGKKPYEHPQRHINKPVVITLDVKNCFPSITNKQVFDVWHKQLKCSHEVARLATKLTTRKGHLPLGAPTSTDLANLALQPCLTNVMRIASEFGFLSDSNGQYIDDLAFSGPILPKTFINSIVKEFLKHGFRIRRDKIKVMRSNEPQVVTKKVVNRKVSIPLKRRNKIRAALHNLKNMGTKDLTYKKQYRSLRGRINDLKDFHPNLAKKAEAEFDKLTNPDNLTRLKCRVQN